MNLMGSRRTSETEGVGTLLLSLWLIATAVLLLFRASVANEGVILAVLAVTAGVLLVLRESSRVGRADSATQRDGKPGRHWRGVSANLGILVLSLWLIITAVLFLTKISFANQEMILAVLAIAAGALLLLRQGGVSPNLGWRLLSAWLIVQGALVLLGVSFNQSGIIMAVLGLAAGIMILLRR